MKNLFIKRQIKTFKDGIQLKSYPSSIENIGLVFSEAGLPDHSFTDKLRACFGKNVSIHKFSVSNKSDSSDLVLLNKKVFNLFGKLKDPKISEILKDLDVIIDMSFKNNIIKSFAFNLSVKSYKIAMGRQHNDFFHLTINVERGQYDVFAEEIIKYHKILSHVKK